MYEEGALFLRYLALMKGLLYAGVAGYRTWRRFCDSERSYDSWEDLERGLDKEFVKDLKDLYQ